MTPGPVIERGSFLWPAEDERPTWLADDVRCEANGLSGWYGRVVPASEWAWGVIKRITVPADHSASLCATWNAAHPDQEPFWPWLGGEEAPGDWDEGEVLLRDADTFSPSEDARWAHIQLGGDIAGYRKRKPATQPADPDMVCVRRMSEGEWFKFYKTVPLGRVTAFLDVLGALGLIKPAPPHWTAPPRAFPTSRAIMSSG